MTRPTIATTIIASLVLAATFASSWPAAPQDQDISQMFDAISTLRAEGRFDQAIAELQNIIKRYTESDEILMRAYNEVVYSLLQKSEAQRNSQTAAAIYKEAEAQATRALTRYPNLDADQKLFPEPVRTLYRSVRSQIFGHLVVTSVPDSSHVFVDGEFKGATPLDIKYFPVGDFTLTLTKSGFVDQSMSLTVLPNRDKDVPVSLRKERTKKWWLTRVFGPVGAGLGAIAALVIANQSDPPAAVEPDPLPGPPDPPAQ